MLRSITLMFSIDCVACRVSLPINGLVSQVRCYQCGTETSLPPEWWASTLGPEEFAAALACEPGDARTTTTLGHPSVRAAYGQRTPRCQACKGPDLDVARLAALVPRGQVFCPGCGKPMRLREPDALCHHVNPRARFVLGETAQDAAAMALQAKTSPVLFPCMGCGGGLHVDGSSRQVTCAYCSASNFLPDGIWMKLRPVPTPQPFFLVCEYDDVALEESTWLDDDARRAAAARPDRTPAQLERLAGDDDDDVRAAVAANPAAPPHLLERLAGDDDDDVRAAVAANPAAPPRALERLAGDDDYEVRATAAGNPAAPPAALVQLAGDSDSDVKRALARNPALPLEALHRLLRDDDDDVKQAAQQRRAELQAQGVDVNAGRGLLGRLFGG